MKIFSIETSCDETAMALVDCHGGLEEPRFEVLKSEISSQVELHREYGGVVPGLAKREHIKNLPLIYESILTEDEWKQVDAIAVTVGPGLEPALWTGISFAKEIAEKRNLPLIGANHLEGHLYSPLLTMKENIELPAIGLVVSGGHTILLALESIDKWEKIGETRDDAVGEAFDKVARLIDLPYPGGPEIQREAEKGDPEAVDLPRPMMDTKDYDFSFSGLKTAVLYHVKGKEVTDQLRRDTAASFQAAAIEVLAEKTFKAAWGYRAKSIILAGGVAANKPLREELDKRAKDKNLNFYVSDMKYSTDNAAMIAAAAYINKEKGNEYKIEAQANLNL